MENASKALLIAGGILIALLVIGALVLMFNQIGSYQQAQDSNQKDSQLAEFNKDFEKYIDDKGITGADVISVINKVIDYNNKANKGGVSNSVDYEIKMSITISGLDTFNSKYAYENETYKLFKTQEYIITNTNQLKSDLNKAKDLEDNYGIDKDQLKILSGMYDRGNKNGSIERMRDKLVELKGDRYNNWNGSSDPKLDTIIKYRQYWEFKTSKFKPDGDPVYKNGQIQTIKFKFDG